MSSNKIIFVVLIVIYLAIVKATSSECMCNQYNQYEKSEVLEPDNRREILKESRTIFLPEKIICFKKPFNSKTRKKRNYECSVFGPRSPYCYEDYETIENGDFRNMTLENLNFTETNYASTPKPDINISTEEDSAESENDKSVLVVIVNITNFDDNLGQKDIKHSMDSDKKEICDDANDSEEQEIFWHNGMSKAKIRQLQSKIMRKYMNTEINPCDDFYGYACGNWKNYFKIPPDRSSYDTFEIIRENLDKVLNNFLKDKAEQRNTLLSTLQKPDLQHLFSNENVRNDTIDATLKAKYFYDSCMNEEVLLKRNGEPLLAMLDLLGGWPMLMQDWSEDQYDLFNLLARLRLLNNDVLISQWIGPDMKNANEYIVHIDQTTLGLPTRDYFLDPKNIKYVRAYKILIIGTAKLLGGNVRDIENDVDNLVDFETMLAEIMASTEERKNITDIYLKTDLASMTVYFPQYDWEFYFNTVLGTDVSLDTSVAVYCVKYLLELVYLLSNTEHRIIQNYVVWRFVRHRLNSLDSRFLDIKQRFNFVLYGREKQPQRWQFCVTQVNTHMGMAMGSLFVRRYFDETSKNDTIQMTQALMASFKAILKENTWLDDHTKQYAEMKIDNMDLKIGFPDFVLNNTELSLRYYDVSIHPEYFFENVLGVLRHLSRVEQRRLVSEVNRTLWSTSPAVVNAYYSRNKNQIMFPAGILQPPFYHKHFPKALNFGGIGVVIGHEMTHGFDDKGRLFDQQGNLMMWWRESSIRHFYEKAQCMIDQYSQYMLPQIKVPIDGFLTQGENIADNGGLKEAFRAYQTWLSENPNADESLSGLNVTNNQLFFLNFAQVWCGQQRIEEAKNRMKTSVHSPGIFRIIGVLSNSEEFAREFNCPLNSPMNPVKKCTIW